MCAAGRHLIYVITWHSMAYQGLDKRLPHKSPELHFWTKVCICGNCLYTPSHHAPPLPPPPPPPPPSRSYLMCMLLMLFVTIKNFSNFSNWNLETMVCAVCLVVFLWICDMAALLRGTFYVLVVFAPSSQKAVCSQCTPKHKMNAVKVGGNTCWAYPVESVPDM